MAVPSIRLNQSPLAAGTTGESREDLVVGTVVSGTDTANATGPWQWVFARPADSSAVASGLTTNDVQFTPDTEGTYLLFVTVSGTTDSFTTDFGEKVSTQGGAGVKLSNGRRIPGVGETNQFDAVSGWATTATSMIKEDIGLLKDEVPVSGGPFISLNFEDAGSVGVSITESGTGAATITISGAEGASAGGGSEAQSTLTDASTIAVDADDSHNFELELTGASGTLSNPINVVAGDQFNFAVRQNHAGNWPLSFDTSYRFPKGISPLITTAVSGEDWVSCYVRKVDGTTADIMLCNSFHVRGLPNVGANALLHLDGSEQNQVTFDSTIGDGEDITGWQDLSGKRNDFIQTTEADMPSWHADVQNGLGAVLFVATGSPSRTAGEYLQNAAPFLSGTSPAEVFFVLQVVDASSEGDGWCRFGSHSLEPAYTFSDTWIYDGFGSTARKNQGASATIPQTWHILNIQSESGNYQTYQNDDLFFSTATNTNGWASTFRIGLSDTLYWGGYIGEIIIYDSVLSSTGRQRIRDHLNIKWNLGF